MQVHIRIKSYWLNLFKTLNLSVISSSNLVSIHPLLLSVLLSDKHEFSIYIYIHLLTLYKLTPIGHIVYNFYQFLNKNILMTL